MKLKNVLLLGLLFVLIGCYFFLKAPTAKLSDNSKVDATTEAVTETPPPAPPTITPEPLPDPNDERLNRIEGEGVEFVPAIAISDALATNTSNDELDVIGDIDQLFRVYRYFFKENPICSSNSHVVRQLAGDNQKNLILLRKNNPRINGEGELMDRWGMPYFFHALEQDKMEIRSSGPDKVMWTDDDVYNMNSFE